MDVVVPIFGNVRRDCGGRPVVQLNPKSVGELNIFVFFRSLSVSMCRYKVARKIVELG